MLVLSVFVFSFLVPPSDVSCIVPIPNPELSSTPERLDPIGNTTFFNYDPVYDYVIEFGGFCVSPDNHVYLAANLDKNPGGMVVELKKTDYLGNLIWTRENDISEIGYVLELASSNDTLYTIGCDDDEFLDGLRINGFDSEGLLSWTTELDYWGLSAFQSRFVT